MAHALGEMYYLAGLMEERRQKLEKKQEQKQEQKQDPQIHPGLVFISPRVPKEFDTVLPSDTGNPTDTSVYTDDWCVIA
jgi:hypothetical protein